MEEALSTSVAAELTVTPKKYPIFLLQNNRIYIRLTSETELVQIYGEQFSEKRWEWYSSSHGVSAHTTAAMLEDPSYVPISEEEFNQVRARYLDFHRNLLNKFTA